MKKLLIIFISLALMIIMGCNGTSSVNYKIPGCGDEFNKDTIEMMKIIEEEVKNKEFKKTNYLEDGSLADEYLKKYEKSVLNTNEQQAYDYIDEALTWHSMNFVHFKGEKKEFDEQKEIWCIESLEKIYDIK